MGYIPAPKLAGNRKEPQGGISCWTEMEKKIINCSQAPLGMPWKRPFLEIMGDSLSDGANGSL